MTALEGIAANLRAVLASHVSLQLVDGRGLGPSHNVERNGLVRVAAETADFEIEVASVEGVTERRRRLAANNGGRALHDASALREAAAGAYCPHGEDALR